jgi:hypothetical protein
LDTPLFSALCLDWCFAVTLSLKRRRFLHLALLPHPKGNL